MSTLFSLESMLEGAPLLFLACIFLHKESLSGCWHMNCDPTALREEFPATRFPGFNSTELFVDEYAAAMQTHPGCSDQPMSSDGWFMAHTTLRSGEFMPWHFLGRRMAFRLEGTISHVLLPQLSYRAEASATTHWAPRAATLRSQGVRGH